MLSQPRWRYIGTCIYISLAILFFVGIVVLKKQDVQHDNDK